MGDVFWKEQTNGSYKVFQDIKNWIISLMKELILIVSSIFKEVWEPGKGLGKREGTHLADEILFHHLEVIWPHISHLRTQSVSFMWDGKMVVKNDFLVCLFYDLMNYSAGLDMWSLPNI